MVYNLADLWFTKQQIHGIAAWQRVEMRFGQSLKIRQARGFHCGRSEQDVQKSLKILFAV